MSIEKISNRLNKLCRLCGGNNPIIHIFNASGSPSLSTQVMSYAQIQIKQGDGLPEMICEKCSYQVNISYHFKLQCEDSDRSFRSLLSGTSITKDMSSKLPFQLKLESISDNEDEKKQFDSMIIEECMQSYTQITDPDDSYSSNDEKYLSTLKRSNLKETKCNSKKKIKVESHDSKTLREVDDILIKYDSLNPKVSKNQCDIINNKINSLKCNETFNKKSDELLKSDISHGKKNARQTKNKIWIPVNICNHEMVTNDEFDDKVSTLCHLCGKKYVHNIHQHSFLSIKSHKVQNNLFNVQLRKLNSLKWTEMKKKTEEISNRRYMCDVCGLTYRCRSILLQHKNTHNAVKMHNCNICGKKFTRNSHVIAHMRIHNNIKPYVCETCGKTFTKSSDLCRHKKVHSDVRNYACSICNRRFKRSGDITSHMRTHTGDKPYSCSKCNKAYSSHSSLRKHRKMHCNSKSKFTQNNENVETKTILSI